MEQNNTKISLISIVIVISFIIGGIAGGLVSIFGSDYLAQLFNYEPSKELIIEKTIKVEEDSAVVNVVEKVSPAVVSIVVTKDGKVVGIITERDITRITVAHIDHSYFEDTIGNYMKAPLVTVEPDMSIWDALEFMIDSNIKRLPIVKDKELLGVVTEKDIVVWILKIAVEPNFFPRLKQLINKLERQETL